MNWPEFISVLGYNERWRKNRRLIHPWLHKKAAESFHRSQEHEARLLLQRLIDSSSNLDDSEKIYGEFFRLVFTTSGLVNTEMDTRTLAGTLMRSIYGYQVKGVDDPLVIEVHRAVDNLAKAAVPSSTYGTYFPLSG